MKNSLIIVFLLLPAFLYCEDVVLEYGDFVSLRGTVKMINYELPSGYKLTTFLLELDKSISVNSNDKWEGHSGVTEVHLNISNDKINEYSNKTIQVSGKIFHALTIHHRRDICIKVEKIELNK